ncbi:hypothetical protein FOZ63_025308, partial [Perkinsus olseni]
MRPGNTLFMLSTFKPLIEVCAHGAAAPEPALSGLYQSVDEVPYFDGLAMRLFGEKRCALVFLAGMPAQHFLSSFETTKMEMKSYDPPGNSRRYLLFDKDCKARYTLIRARTLTTEFGQRMDFGVNTIFPRISKRGNVTLKVGDVILRMKKISNDPREALEVPFERPSPGVYVNDGPISDATLSSAEVTVDDKRGCSLQIGLPNNSTLRHSVGCMANRDRSQRCLWFAKKAGKSRLFPDSPALADGHFLRDLKLSDAGICETPRLQLYLVVGRLNILLKPASTSESYQSLRTSRRSSTEMLHAHRKRSSGPRPASGTDQAGDEVTRRLSGITIGTSITAPGAVRKTEDPLADTTRTRTAQQWLEEDADDFIHWLDSFESSENENEWMPSALPNIIPLIEVLQRSLFKAEALIKEPPGACRIKNETETITPKNE